ncbi:MAG: sulfite exporter TauE/SafE family protein [Candidatus Omnitrophica bacterium]|nr:sulfite exporter TauE/SafE family protein [Candidatus Omnitrophota bacterium]
MKEILYLVLGLTAGTLSGMFGIGGGTILIPALVFLVGLSQHEAQGTTLAIMLLPIGLLAVMKYYHSGHVHFYIAAFICIGFLIGGLLGANMAEMLSNLVLRKAFGIFLLIIALYTIFAK